MCGSVIFKIFSRTYPCFYYTRRLKMFDARARNAYEQQNINRNKQLGVNNILPGKDTYTETRYLM